MFRLSRCLRACLRIRFLPISRDLWRFAAAQGGSFAWCDAPRGGTVLFTIAFVLLGVWVVSLSGIVPGGQLAHAFLLVGLMFLLLSFAKSRDAAGRSLHAPPGGHDHR